jgi:hypothetical protein
MTWRSPFFFGHTQWEITPNAAFHSYRTESDIKRWKGAIAVRKSPGSPFSFQPGSSFGGMSLPEWTEDEGAV